MLALQALCIYEGLGDAFSLRLAEFLADPQTHEDLSFDAPPGADLLGFAHSLAQDAWSRRGALDELLDSTARHWRTARMTPVDRNVLRLGIHELLEYPETPVQVVINEAIELARHFGDAASPNFVNGVLDAVRRKIRPPVATDPPAAAPTAAVSEPPATDAPHGAF